MRCKLNQTAVTLFVVVAMMVLGTATVSAEPKGKAAGPSQSVEKSEVVLKNGKTISLPSKAAETLVEKDVATPAVATHEITVIDWGDWVLGSTFFLTPAPPFSVVDGESVEFLFSRSPLAQLYPYMRVIITTASGSTYGSIFDVSFIFREGSFTIENVTEDISLKFMPI